MKVCFCHYIELQQNSKRSQRVGTLNPPPPPPPPTPPPSPPHPPSPLLALMAQYWGSSLESGIHVDRCSLFPVESYLWSKHWYSCGFCTLGLVGLDQYTVTVTLAWISILWLWHWPGSVYCDCDIGLDQYIVTGTLSRSVYCDCDIGLDQYIVTGTLAWISILWLGH